MATTLTINGEAKSFDAPADMPLLWVLRDILGMTGTKFGCGIAQCGACTVHIDGKAIRSCQVPVGEAAGKKVTTLEGLGTAKKPHPLQKAFEEVQAVQCGYCINGMVMQAAAFLKENPKPTEAQVKAALENNLCRCGTQTRIVAAVMRASQIA